jgi:hypothetical protein
MSMITLSLSRLGMVDKGELSLLCASLLVVRRWSREPLVFLVEQ